MVDAIAAGPHGLVDHLGRRGRVSADLRAEVDATGRTPASCAWSPRGCRSVRWVGSGASRPSCPRGSRSRNDSMTKPTASACPWCSRRRSSARCTGTRGRSGTRSRRDRTGRTMTDESTQTTKGRAVIAGASGFVGKYLQDAFRDEGYEVVTIGRTGDAVWGNTLRVRELVDGAAIVVNMAGKSVNCRYGRSNRAEIIRSRVDTTLELAEAIRTSRAPDAAVAQCLDRDDLPARRRPPAGRGDRRARRGLLRRGRPRVGGRPVRRGPARHQTGRAPDGDRPRGRQCAGAAPPARAGGARRPAVRRPLVPDPGATCRGDVPP